MTAYINSIKSNIQNLFSDIPPHVAINAASKYRTKEEITTAIECGIKHIGFNYIQEGVRIIKTFPPYKVKFHLIGHLQSNKVKMAVEYFHSIDTVHSFNVAKAINNRASEMNKTMDILIQVKDQKEAHKNGVFLNQLDELIFSISGLNHLCIKGLLVMGAFNVDTIHDDNTYCEELRYFFEQCHKAYKNLKTIKQKNLNLTTLSMGMSDTYLIAIKEGANQIRLGTSIYGPRPIKQFD